MEKVEAFKANDGSLFSSEDEAIAHEEALKWNGKLAAFSASGLCPYPSGAHNGMARKIIIAWETFKSIPARSGFATIEMDDPIERLELTARSENCLKAEGIKTVAGLLTCSAERLLKTQNLGSKSLNEIVLRLREYGMNLYPT